MLTVGQHKRVGSVEVRNRAHGILDAILIAAVREAIATHPDYNPNPTTEDDVTDIIPTPVCCNCGTDQAHMYHNAGGGRFACHGCWTVGGLVKP